MTEEQYKLFMDQLDYINTDFPEAYLMYSVNDDLASHTKVLDEVLNKVELHISQKRMDRTILIAAMYSI